ncbi:MAG: hypothetical protein CO136_00960, partial [Candidatus Levybacteria bacterium CG_4_9_14_3_um_filter_36_7]
MYHTADAVVKGKFLGGGSLMTATFPVHICENYERNMRESLVPFVKKKFPLAWCFQTRGVGVLLLRISIGGLVIRGVVLVTGTTIGVLVLVRRTYRDSVYFLCLQDTLGAFPQWYLQTFPPYRQGHR